MSKSKETLAKLIEKLETELKEQKYHSSTINRYKRTWKDLVSYVGTDDLEYTEEIGDKYLKARYGDIDKSGKNYSKTVRESYRSIRVLGDYQMHGAILRSKGLVSKIWGKEYAQTLEAFKEYAVGKELTKESIHRIEQVLDKLFKYLYFKKITDCRELRREDIGGFIKTLSGYAIKTLSISTYSLRVFLGYLYEDKITFEDLRKYVPKLKYVKRRNIPSTWTEEEIKKILESIDRGNAPGKRDYAILLMIARLGLRKSDILNLRFSNIDWEKSVITITQKKTKELLTLPLLDDVGNAVIDYLKNGRPNSDLPLVFLKQAYPFGQLTDIYQILDKYLRFSGVGRRKDKHNGPHSLRHSLAGHLLEKDTPVEIISSILGHSSINVTNEYLKIDLKSLSECALDPEEVLGSVSE